jgi:hypothetical protein
MTQIHHACSSVMDDEYGAKLPDNDIRVNSMICDEYGA